MKTFLKLLAAASWALLPLRAGAQFGPVGDLDDKYAAGLVKKGSEAPGFEIETMDGGKIALSSFRGKWTVLDFWASWCPDCRKDIPDVVRMYGKFHPKGVEFIGISFDTDKESWKSMVQKSGMDYPQVSELVRMNRSPVAKAYGLNWIPSMVVVNPEGRVELATVDVYKVEKLLEETFADKSSIPGSAEKVSIDGSVGKLSAIIQKPLIAEGEKVPVAILMHGFTSDKDAELLRLIADNLQREGIASVRFDFNGHGESEGEFEKMTVVNEIEDAMKVYDYVRALPYAGEIALAGHSQGGVVASMAAGRLGSSKVGAVALLAPAAVLREDAIRGNTQGALYDPLDPPEKVALRDGLYLGAGYIRTAFSLPIYETAAGYDGPALMVHGNADHIVPYTYSERYHAVWPDSRLVILNRYDHGFSQNRYRAAELASSFIAETLLK